MKLDKKDFETRMKKTIASYETDLESIRVGRANPNVLNKITVDYWGVPTQITQVGEVKVPDAKTITITPWESNMLKAIEKAILASDIGITPANDGQVIRLVFPELTEDRRKELVKDIKKKAEAAKVAVRNVRRDANDAIKKAAKASEISEDEQKQIEDEIQKTTDKFVAEIDKCTEAKTAEIMTV